MLVTFVQRSSSRWNCRERSTENRLTTDVIYQMTYQLRNLSDLNVLFLATVRGLHSGQNKLALSLKSVSRKVRYAH